VKGDNDMKAKYLLLVGVILICCIVLLSCAGKKKMQPVAPKDPAVLYTEGMVLFNKGKYKDAIEVFTRLKDYFPSDELYAPKADLRIADSNCFRKEYPEAITRYLEFKKQYTFHPDIPYVEYQLGICYYRQVLSKDRDQKATERALASFENVVANYPDTIFAEKAQEKIIFCRRRLAENELYIARFYLRRHKYVAAEKRASSALERYPASGIDDQALYYLAFALHKQERDPEALTPLTLLVEKYPQSEFAKPGGRLLASLQTQGVVAVSPASEEMGILEAKPIEPAEETFPFRVTASKTENILGSNATLYTGDVVARGEEVIIRAESLLLTMDEDDVPTEMVARDEVVVTMGENELFSKKAVWSPIQNTIVMTEDVKIREPGGVWTRGDEITLHLDTGKLEVKGARPLEGPGDPMKDKLEDTLGR
jgi:outer membrane protein assembly factor BamD